MRNVLRSFGETHYLRIQGYTSILILFFVMCWNIKSDSMDRHEAPYLHGI